MSVYIRFVLISGYEFRMVQHLYEMVFLLNSSMAMDLVTIACFLVSIVTLVLLLVSLLPLSRCMYSTCSEHLAFEE